MSDLVPIVVGGLLTLIAGAGTEWFRHSRSVSRDREARQEARQERLDDLQRQTLVELQDALHAYVRGISAAAHFDEMSRRETGQKTLLPADLDDRIHQAQVLSQKLVTRVDDPEIRTWVAQIVEICTTAMMSGGDDPRLILSDAWMLAQQAQEKMGILIRRL